jgi:aconitate hydratase
MLPLTFANPEDYDKIDPTAKVDILGLKDFQPGKSLLLKVHNPNGSVEEIPVNHSFNESKYYQN